MLNDLSIKSNVNFETIRLLRSTTIGDFEADAVHTAAAFRRIIAMSQYAAANPVRDIEDSNVGLAVASLVGRVLISAIFLLSGLSKIAASAATIGYISSAGLPLPQAGLAIAVVVEVVGSIALIAGFQTRWAAAILAVFTIVAALVFHNNFADQSQFINFFKNVSITGGLLQIIAFGAGRFSLDARRH
jgi:putative oxidoreductase